ncbi:MAG: phosphatase PAP2 family protein [bacterium]|nr:phosphatase PAP2 family protein [bacterium]
MKKLSLSPTLYRSQWLAATVIFSMLFTFSVQAPVYCRDNVGNEDDERLSTQYEKEERERKRIIEPVFKKKRKTNNLLLFGGLALTTVFLIKNDTYLNRGALDFAGTNRWAERGSPVITHLGSVSFSIGMIGSFYVAGKLFKDPRAKETARLGLRSLLYTMAISRVLKSTFRRQRPYVEDGIDSWFNSERGNDYRSFPSGHTTMAWSMATVVAGMYKDKPAVPVIAYSLATLAGLSRMTENKHWASDVLIGAVLGYSIGRFVLRKHSNRLFLGPVISPNRAGLNLTYAF